MEATRQSRSLSGVAYASAAYLTWGLFPFYFHALGGVPAPEILAHRILWSAAFMTFLITGRRRWNQVIGQLRCRATVGALALSAAFISMNWVTYIWAVNSGRVLEASLGYYINPLVTVLLGVVFLREPLTGRQKVAVALAGLGVTVLVIRGRHVPWVALALAFTFGLYGLIRKRARVDAMAGLLTEVCLLAPLAALYVTWLGRAGLSHFGAASRHSALLAASGVVTAVPLLWFAVGVQRLRLSTVGLLQYLNPTMQFAIAVFAFGEPFTSAHALAFGCIWVSLAVYTAEALSLSRASGQLATRS